MREMVINQRDANFQSTSMFYIEVHGARQSILIHQWLLTVLLYTPPIVMGWLYIVLTRSVCQIIHKL